MKVKATEQYEKLKVADKILDRIPKTGEEFEVSEERYIELTQNNEYKVAFVEKIEEKQEIETAVTEIKKERERKLNNDI